MIKQLLKQIWIQRSLNIWLWVELIIVSVCLSYVADYLYRTGSTYFSSLGYNTEHVYRVYLAEVPKNAEAFLSDVSYEARTEHLQDVLARLRAYPGVEFASVSLQTHPYNQGNASGMRGIDTIWIHGYVYHVSPQFFNVFQIKNKHGKTEPLVAAATGTGQIMIASEEAERKFTEKGINLLTQKLKYGDLEPDPSLTVSAICADTRFDDFRDLYPMFYHCKPEAEYLHNESTHAEICVRVAPEAETPEFLSEFRNAMKTQLRIGNIYLVDIVSFDDIRTNYYRANGLINEVKMHIAGVAFLLLNIFMAVIGSFWIRTQQRRAEIGLRLALGASESDIRSTLLVEGMILLFLAMIPSVFINANIVFSELTRAEFTISRFIITQLITYGLIAIMIFIGISLPAQQAMKIKPMEALKDE